MPLSRFGLVVSTKVDKRAVIRNRIRRQVREIIRLKLAKIKPGFDVMIVLKKAAIGQKHADLSQDLFEVLEKAKLLC